MLKSGVVFLYNTMPITFPKHYKSPEELVDLLTERGLSIPEAEGRAEGEQKKNLENAKKMKDMGLSFDIIMQVTGLPIEEIEKL